MLFVRACRYQSFEILSGAFTVNGHLVKLFPDGDVMSSADGGEEQAAAGEAGARRAEAAADDAEGRDAAGGRGRAGAEDSGPHEGRNSRAAFRPTCSHIPTDLSSLEFFFFLSDV